MGNLVWLRKPVLLLLAVVMAGWVGTSDVHAQVANPAMTLTEVHGLQHLIQEGDLLILVRYELPKATWRVDSVDDPNYPFMEEADCFENNENYMFDLCWTSILSGVASHTFYDGIQATGTLIQQRTLPRIGHGLSGLYIAEGHSLTFGTTSYQTCLEGSATVFDPRTINCLGVALWHTVTDTDGDGAFLDDAPAQNAEVFRDLGENLQDQIPGRQELIVANRNITPVGAIFFTEAYTNVMTAAPEAFSIAEQETDNVSLNTGNTAAETSIQTEAQGSRLWGWVSDFNTNHFDGALPVPMVGAVLVILIGVVMFGALLYFTQSMFLALAVVATFIFGFGALQDLFDFNLYMILLTLFFASGIFLWARHRI